MADIKKIRLNSKDYDIVAVKLADARTISLTGGVSGSGSFDGSANLSIATTLTSHTHNQSDITQASGDYLILDCGSSTVLV